jgi:hypothetical protein
MRVLCPLCIGHDFMARPSGGTLRGGDECAFAFAGRSRAEDILRWTLPTRSETEMKAIGFSSVRAGCRVKRRQWLASVTFENGSAGKSRSIIIIRKSSRSRSGSRADSIRSSFPFR